MQGAGARSRSAHAMKALEMDRMKMFLLAVLLASTLAGAAQQAATGTNLEIVVGNKHLALTDAFRSMPHITLT